MCVLVFCRRKGKGTFLNKPSTQITHLPLKICILQGRVPVLGLAYQYSGFQYQYPISSTSNPNVGFLTFTLRISTQSPGPVPNTIPVPVLRFDSSKPESSNSSFCIVYRYSNSSTGTQYKFCNIGRFQLSESVFASSLRRKTRMLSKPYRNLTKLAF